MINKNDNCLSISYSGETDEVIKLIPFSKNNVNFFISFTGSPHSTLAKIL